MLQINLFQIMFPNDVKANVNPSPIPIPSTADFIGVFLDAKLSARANIKQLTTIKGMNNPSAASNAGIYALSNIPTIVTKVAITTINAGILILAGINFLINDITMLEQIKTAVVESPIPNPFIADVVTPKVGHIPIT